MIRQIQEQDFFVDLWNLACINMTMSSLSSIKSAQKEHKTPENPVGHNGPWGFVFGRGGRGPYIRIDISQIQ